MPIYTLEIKSRKYGEWDWVENLTKTPVTHIQKCEFPFPIPARLFHGDQYCSDTQKVLFTSPIRTAKSITGILVLEGNRTYGRQQMKSAKNPSITPYMTNTQQKGRLYYRCIPSDIHYPVFLVPYKLVMEFSKHIVNSFILFQYKDWTDAYAPYGLLIETIGDVNHLPSYYRYLLLCNRMSYQVTQWIPSDLRVMMTQSDKTEGGYVETEEDFIFSIDPEGSKDLDDAFSFQWRETNVEWREAVVRIYIADVVYWIDKLDIWDAMRIDKIGCSTIYLPEQNHPMLPRWMSDKGASLLEGEMRPVVGLELVFRQYFAGKMVCQSKRFFRKTVKINRNYRYDTVCGHHYQNLLLFTRLYLEHTSMTKKAKTEIHNSHDLVEYWMIEYNIHAADAIAVLGKGIFRVSKELVTSGCNERQALREKEDIGKATQQFLKHYKSIKGEYVLFNAGAMELYNTSIREWSYVYYAHASSPLRRMVDIYNQLEIIYGIECHDPQNAMNVCELGNMELKEKQDAFREHMEKNVQEINAMNKRARRIQTECEMLSEFFRWEETESCPIYTDKWTGTVVDIDSDAEEVIGYWVFLEEWKRLVYVARQKNEYPLIQDIREIGQIGKYQIFLFEEEEKAHKKVVIRLAE